MFIFLPGFHTANESRFKYQKCCTWKDTAGNINHISGTHLKQKMIS